MIVLSGPSGVGKSSLSRKLSRQPGFFLSVSATTRSPRPGEKDGTDYHFLSREEFQKQVEKGEFIEHAEVFGHLYGTLLAPIQKQLKKGNHVVLDIDVQGGASVRKTGIPSLLFFIVPPSPEELERRIRGRKTEKEPEISKRLKEMEREMSLRGLYDFIVVNDSLERALKEILTIIKKEEGFKSSRKRRIKGGPV